jgi:anti-sigma-K factor RskA
MNPEMSTSAQEPASTRELLELASLDALGLLDGDEREAFERAFEAAPRAVREQIRREQGRIAAADDALLPEVDPPAGLRARVRGAVRDAMDRVRSERDVVGRIAPNAWSLRRNVSPLWRAACLAFATATISLLVAGFHVRQTYNESLASAADGALAEQIARELGDSFVEVLLSPTAERVALQPVLASASFDRFEGRGEGLLMFDQDAGVGLLVVRNLPVLEGEYEVVLMDDVANVRETLVRFRSEGELQSRRIDPKDLRSGMVLAIIPIQAGDSRRDPVLTTTI